MNVYKFIKTEEDYNELLKSGMFWEFHPELTGDWKKDSKVINLPEHNPSIFEIKIPKLGINTISKNTKEDIISATTEAVLLFCTSLEDEGKKIKDYL